MPVWAAIDLGTNTAKLIVARREPGDPTWGVIAQEVRTPRIGVGIGAGEPLRADAKARALETLAQFCGIARDRGAVQIAAVATSAVRDASNGREFADEASRVMGIPLRVIDGALEAELGFRGACCTSSSRAALRDVTGPVLLIDIGGGSAQAVLGIPPRMMWHVSAPVGAVRLTEQCVSDHPVREDDLAALHAAARDKLRPALASCPARPAVILGVGGTLTTLAAVDCAASHGDLSGWSRIQGYRLSRSDIAGQIERLRVLPLEERRDVVGLDPSRADIIIAGAVVAETFLFCLQQESIIITTGGVRWGLLEALAAGEWKG